MTIIAVKDGFMAADSESVTARGLRSPMPFPKIFRGPGGLIGMTGTLSDIWAVGQWFVSGELGGAKPDGLKVGEEGVGIIILRPDGVVWHGNESLRFWPGENPSTTGMSTACYFCEGAMAAGMSAEEAVRLTISRVDHIGGPVQVEHLIEPVVKTEPVTRCVACDGPLLWARQDVWACPECSPGKFRA